MNDAQLMRAEITTLNEQAHEIVVSIRFIKAKLQELATAYGDISPRLQNVEFMLAATENQLNETLQTIHTSVHRAEEFASNL